MTRVLITGCSSGIGRATAEAMARRDYEVVATARRLEALDGLVVSQKLQLDVDDAESVREAVRAAGDVDVLVNNAAWEIYGPAEELPADRVLAMFNTNVVGALRLVQAVVPGMRERRRGAVVNISSAAAVYSTPLNGAYAATKHALEALSESLRYELGHWNIRIVVIEPGEIDTPWHQKNQLFGKDGPYAQLIEDRFADYPNAEAPSPEVVAEAIITAVEDPEPKFRWPVSMNLEYVAARRRMTDEQWEQAYRTVTKLDW